MEAILKKEIISHKLFCRIIGVLTFVIFTSLGAFVRIPLPFTPVPITLQTFFVLLSGAFLGSSLGAITQVGYLFLGVAGFPIFSGAGSGLFYFLGPTGGYLLGFVLASFFIGGLLKYTKDNLLSTFLFFCLADFIILLSGLLWLKVLFAYSWIKLFCIGFIPFLPGDFLKALLASVLYLRLKTRLKEIF
jgi:biotin transport system substrate-specific component